MCPTDYHLTLTSRLAAKREKRNWISMLLHVSYLFPSDLQLPQDLKGTELRDDR